MRRALLSLAFVGAVLPATGIAGGPCTAAAEAGVNRVGLVVQSPGKIHEFCVAFIEEGITGLELLERSGLSLSVKQFQGQGAAICRIDGIGCTHDDCFCRCRSRTCEIWGYHTLEGNRWISSSVGADRRVVVDGDVDGWRWGPSTVSDGGVPPRDADLDGICLRGRRIAASTPADPDRGAVGLIGAAAFAVAVAGLLLVTAMRRRAHAREAR